MTTMMILQTLFLFSWLWLLPRPLSSCLLTSPASSALASSNPRATNEYRALQETLLRDLAMHKKVEAEQVAQVILEKAVDVAAVQRYQQMEIVDEAQEELMHATDDRMRAHALHEQAHAEAMSAEHEASLIESLDAGYEDMERLRDLSVAHAAHNLENDTEDLEITSAFKEVEASSRKEAAEELLKQLEENEAQLKDSLKQMRDFPNTKAIEEWKNAEAPKHKMFLDKVKELMNRLDMVKQDVMNKHPDLGS
jgi:hypothetical protein